MSFSDVLLVLAALGSTTAWFVAVVSAIAMTRHRAPGVTLFHLATRGMAFFDETLFTEAATPHRIRFGRAFLAFFLFVFLGMGLGVVASR